MLNKVLNRTLLTLAALVLMLLLAAAAGLGLLASESGSRWVLARVPGLTVDNFNGRLAGAWRADRLWWAQPGQHVQLRNVDFAWSPVCLLRMTLCLDRLHVDQVLVQLAPSDADSANNEPLQLPDLKLPVSLELGDIQIGSVQLDGADQVQNLQLAAHWNATGLQIDSLKVQRDAIALDLHGTLQPQDQWPLRLDGVVQLPPVDGKAWQLALNIQGELLHALQLNGRSSGYLDAGVSGQVQPLASGVPARLHIDSQHFEAGADLPDTLALNELVLDAKGDLQTGYEIAGSASLPADQGAVALQLRGRVDAKGADIAGLSLAASAEQRLALSGRIDWQQGLAADAKVEWQDFPWYRLYPQVTEPAVSLQRFNAEVSYRDGNYLGNFSSALKGPAGDFTVVSPFSGNLHEVFLPQLSVRAGQGKAEGHLNVQFAQGIGWDTALDVSALNPAYWVAQLPGTLAGPLRSTGRFSEGHLQAQADIDLKGRLRGQPAALLAKVDGEGERWTLGALLASLGDNKINGSASVQQRLAGRIDLDLPRLGQLWPDLQGRLKGRIDIAGTLQAPQGQALLGGQQLGLADNHVQTLDLQARLDGAQRANLDLTASGIQAGNTALGTLTAKGQGTLQKQQVQLDLTGPLLRLALGLDGGLDRGNWRGRLASGDIQAGGQDWRLQNPATLQRLANGQIDFGAHCWRSGTASLCGEDQRLAPEPRLRYHLKQFPIESLAQWLPKDLGWQGQLNADVQLDLPASGPKGRVAVDASGGTLRIRDNGQWLDFPYQALRLDSNLTPRRVDTQVVFRGGKLGDLQLDAQIDPLARDKPLSGSFSLQGLDLSVARPFVPMVERLNGHLQGNGRLAGSLLVPQVNGDIELRDGEVAGAQLPMSLQALQVQARIAGENVQLNGTWKSGDKGQGTLGGTLGWAQGLAVNVDLKGTRLPVTVEPYATLEVTPALNVHMSGGRLAVSGNVAIPTGSILVRELPPSTVKLSDDAVIVGHQTEEGKAPLAIAMDINVDVGQDKLTFSGFGLSANLVGRVHIGDNLDTRGELNLKDGRYAAYGQRLTIRRARLFFAGPLDQPYLDIEAIRQVDDVIAGIRLTGSAEQPTSEVFAEPAMSQEQALSYLVLGRPLSTTGEDNNLLAQAALGLGLAGSSSLTGSVAKELGIQDFQLDTAGSGTTTNVVASGKITEKLSLRYGVGVFEPANTIALRYLLSKKVYLEVASGVASSLDIFYKRDF
jgi:translocation and assembly module TamB